MRSLLLSVALLTAAALAVLTPGEASAFSRTVYYYTPTSYGAYYAPNYAPGPYYTTATFGGATYVAPAVSSYSMPAYAAPVAPAYYYSPDPASYFTPIYSGPQYFHGYGPNRLWIYP